MYFDTDMSDFWGSIATYLSNASPHSDIEDISIIVNWNIPRSKEIVDLGNERGFVVRNAEALEPILNSSLKGLLTLDLTLWLHWPPEFHDESDRIRIKFSQSAIEEAVRKLFKISEKASVSVSVEHHFE